MVDRYNSRPIPHRPTLEPRKASSRRRGAAPAQRLYETAFPITGTLAETYLRARGLEHLPDFAAIRFQPSYYYRSDEYAEPTASSILIAPVTNLEGQTVGVFRIWLSPHGKSALPVDPARQGLGDLVGNAVRFGHVTDVAIVGIDVESMLSLRAVRPDLPMVAGLTPDLMGVIVWPAQLRSLYIAKDKYPRHSGAYEKLAARMSAAGVAVQHLTPRGQDFNDDLRGLGLEALRQALNSQLPASSGASSR
jgi:hypothetical protein